MDFSQARSELRKIDKRHIFSLASTQRTSECSIGGQPCDLFFHYKGFHFCLLSIMGQGRQMEKSPQLEGKKAWNSGFMQRPHHPFDDPYWKDDRKKNQVERKQS